jgi:uncharacterized membrane-anchored protein
MIKFVRNPIFAAAVSGVLLTAILCYLLVDRILLLRHGREVVLPVEPVDPRDFFKGDYARLRFEISVVDRGLFFADAKSGDRRVFVTLKRDEDGEWKPTAVTPYTPRKLGRNEVVLRGRFRPRTTQTFFISYGLEHYYVPEGTGKKIEELARKSKLSAIVAVDRHGFSAIKGLVVDGKRVYDEPLL